MEKVQELDYSYILNNNSFKILMIKLNKFLKMNFKELPKTRIIIK